MSPNGHTQKLEIDTNVMPRLADFGLALPVTTDTGHPEWIRLTRWRATQGYMSPVSTLHPKHTSLNIPGTTLPNAREPPYRRQNERLGCGRSNAHAPVW